MLVDPGSLVHKDEEPGGRDDENQGGQQVVEDSTNFNQLVS